MTEQRSQFINKVLALRDEAMRLGLPITCRAMGAAVKAVGWELAGEPDKAIRGWSVEP